MRYVQNTIWNKKLPSYAGIAVLLFALGITILLSRNTVTFVTKATIGSAPKSIQISNITDTSFTVSFVTDAAVKANLAYGANSDTTGVAMDTRDQSKVQAEYRVHYFTVENLIPSTKYVFAINSDVQITEKDENGNPFTVSTAPKIASPSAQTQLTGSITLADGGFPTEGIVSVSSAQTQTLTALIQPDGTYRLPISQLRSSTLDTFASLTDSLQLTLDISNGLETASATISADTTEVPKMVLGQSYDFAGGEMSIGGPIATESAEIATDSGTPASESADFPEFEAPKPVSSPEITVPKDGQRFSDSQPLFKGMALANAPISLLIQGDKEIEASLQSDSLGVWEFRPPVALEAGEYAITIESQDTKNTMQKVTRSFTILTEGSQFIEPSVSPIELSPTIDPRTLTPTASPTIDPKTLTPTIDPNATMSGTISPTRGPLNPTGNEGAIMGVVTSVLFLASGVILFFLIAV